MRSLLELPAAYIRPEWRDCVVPGRPWWLARPDKSYASRRDGAFGHPYGYPSKRWFDHEYEEHDAQHPMKHPGYRVGQIWAITFGVEFEGLIQLDMVDAARVDQSEDKSESWNHICCRVKSAARGMGIAPRKGDLHTALLHDPVRPDLAPWSST